MPPTTVLIYGNPTGGTPLMLAAPDFALELLLRLVREGEHGKVCVIYNSSVGEPSRSPKRSLPMEHNGTEYSVVQTISPAGWRWTVRIPGRKPKTGLSHNRQMAANAAKAAIETAIRVKPEKEQTTQ